MNFPLAPEVGVANVTGTFDTGFPKLSVTFNWSDELKLPFTAIDWFEPAVTVAIAAAPGVFVNAKLSESTLEIEAVTV